MVRRDALGMRQIVGHFGKMLVTALGLGIEGAQDDRVEPRRDGGVEARETARRSVEARRLKTLDLAIGVVAGERW